MGVSEEAVHQMEGTAVSVVDGISLRSPLKPILTKPMEKREPVGDDEDYYCSTTPTSAGSRIPTSRLMQCPPAPKKRKSAPMRCHFGGSSAVKEFFNPPDLDTIFIRRGLT